MLNIEEGLQGVRSLSSQQLVPVESEVGDEHDHVKPDPESLSEDLYGAGIAALLRDSLSISQGKSPLLRISRISITTVLLFLTIVLQAFLVWEFKRLVTAYAVHEAREAYDKFETTMYEGHTTQTVNGYRRGIEGHFNPDRFADLTVKEKRGICQIPLSQPWFFGCILAIWSFTVMNDVRKILSLADLLILQTPTISSLQGMLKKGDGHETTLQGLPAGMKALLLFFMFLPRLAIDGILLWLGCRWLTATDTFTDVLLNAMALEFILLLKDLLYEAVVPMRDKHDTRTMLIPMPGSRPDAMSFLGTFLLAFVVVAWVCAYILCLQQVLPEYRWDVHRICEDFINEAARI
mmetsp:Transcript_3480/g.7034  ORF Transcript_3480/g.7034 Transcript_3480/m.7034 type:complete len:349 (-) Transcript_3480:464-1510(-)